LHAKKSLGLVFVQSHGPFFPFLGVSSTTERAEIAEHKHLEYQEQDAKNEKIILYLLLRELCDLCG